MVFDLLIICSNMRKGWIYAILYYSGIVALENWV